MNRLSLLLVLFSIGSLSCAHASIDLVQSVPVETTLEVQGVPTTQRVWIDLFRAAKKTIDMEEFYISNKPGESLEPVLGELVAASKRGVKIRVLVDSKFYANMPTDPNNLAKIPNITLKTIDFIKTNGVMHAKYFIVDGIAAYVGSANFDWLALSHIHEIGLRIVDPKISAALQAVFNTDWASQATTMISHAAAPDVLGSDKRATPYGDCIVTNQITSSTLVSQQQVTAAVYASPPSLNPQGIPSTLDAIVRMMDIAKKSIKVQVYEYSTSVYGSTAHFTKLDDGMRRAAARGVRVELLVDANAMKSGGNDLKALAKVPNIFVKTVVIPQWSGGPLQFARLIHSKYMITDDAIAWIGSENWSGGYFTATRNIGLVLTDKNVVPKLVAVQSRLWNSTYSTAVSQR